jgi:hypothetical protein
MVIKLIDTHASDSHLHNSGDNKYSKGYIKVPTCKSKLENVGHFVTQMEIIFRNNT